MHVISVREHPEYCETAVAYFQKYWANEDSLMVYEDCIRHSLITNDFISRIYEAKL